MIDGGVCQGGKREGAYSAMLREAFILSLPDHFIAILSFFESSVSALRLTKHLVTIFINL